MLRPSPFLSSFFFDSFKDNSEIFECKPCNSSSYSFKGSGCRLCPVFKTCQTLNNSDLTLKLLPVFSEDGDKIFLEPSFFEPFNETSWGKNVTVHFYSSFDNTDDYDWIFDVESCTPGADKLRRCCKEGYEDRMCSKCTCSNNSKCYFQTVDGCKECPVIEVWAPIVAFFGWFAVIIGALSVPNPVWRTAIIIVVYIALVLYDSLGHFLHSGFESRVEFVNHLLFISLIISVCFTSIRIWIFFSEFISKKNRSCNLLLIF